MRNKKQIINAMEESTVEENNNARLSVSPIRPPDAKEPAANLSTSNPAPSANDSRDQYFSFVSMSPARPPNFDTPALKRIRLLQMSEKKTWKGIMVENSGRPGTCNILNKKRATSMHEYQREDEERF